MSFPFPLLLCHSYSHPVLRLRNQTLPSVLSSCRSEVCQSSGVAPLGTHTRVMAIIQDNAEEKKQRQIVVPGLGFNPAPATSEGEENEYEIEPNNMALHDPGKPKCEKRKRAREDGLRNKPVLERAREVQSSLPPDFPSLVKSMLPSHVTGGFWLGLPRHFCSRHLPKEDTAMILEDESGQEYKTKYLWLKVGLSAGWRGFSIAHKLVEGDVVVFQLVKPTKFKVYIVRLNGFNEVDGALGLLELDLVSKKASSDNNSNQSDMLIEDDKNWEPLGHDNELEITNTEPPLLTDVSEHGSDDLVCEVLDGIRFSQSAVEFKDVRSIEDFIIVVNGLVIDSEISKHLKIKYYELCSSQKQFLHEHLVDGLNCKLAAGLVSETVNIADAIIASKITTSPENFSTWVTTLRAFADLGMEVGFLLAWLHKLMNRDIESRRLKDARSERVQAMKEVAELEAKLTEAKKRISRLDSEIETLCKNENDPELLFREVASEAW